MAHAFWPLFDIRITTPRLELRLATDEDFFVLSGLIDDIHPVEEMPFNAAWTRGESPQRERAFVQYHWNKRASLQPDERELSMCVFHEGVPVGIQTLAAEDFSVLRSVSTGSWLTRKAQGQGFGKEMRAAVLWLAFENLEAERATTEACDWNMKSQGVTRSLGYEPNGEIWASIEGKRVRQNCFQMTRERWNSYARPLYEIKTTCPEPCLPMLGAEPRS